MGFKRKAAFILLVYLLAGLFYIGLWHIFINAPFSPAGSHPPFGFSSTNQRVNIETSVDMKIWRYGFLPVYWSRIGDLTGYHLTYFTVSTVGLFLTAAFSYFKTEKTNKVPPTKHVRGVKVKGGQLIITIWAFIGFLWFIIYQILAVIPESLSYILVESLNLFMWIMAFTSLGWLVYPKLKLLYYKIWEGGEKP